MSYRFALMLSLGLPSASVHADVLEVSRGRAIWVAGPAATTNAGPAEASPPSMPLSMSTQLGGPPSTVPAMWTATVATLADRYALSPALIGALVWQESRWNPAARSPVGARGLAQLMPGTARDLGVNPDDPVANLEGGARYLRAQLDRFDGDIERALAAYNAGPGRVIRAGGVPRIRETRKYVEAIVGKLADESRSDFQ